MDDFKRVKEAVDIVEIVGRYVPLKKAGARLVGLCPFHAEKTPSFGVVPGQQFFKCFGCGKGGDVFVFLQQIEHIDVAEALHRLAEEKGIALERAQPGARDEKERLLALLAAAQAHYRRALKEEEGREAVELLKRRCLKGEIARDFGLGFAPARRGALAQLLRESGFSSAEMLAAGVAFDRDGELLDTMRERVTIPIRDERGRVIAFGGRRLRDGPDVREPKYINSRDTALFHKSRVLYGLDRARENVLRQDRAVLVEGYLDVILAHQGGLDAAIAALGTAVTPDHAKALARLSRRVVLFLDSDEAGRRAAVRAVPLLLAEGIEVRVLVLKNDKDPGDFFARGADVAEFERRLKEDGVGGVDFMLVQAGVKEARSIDDRIRIARALAEGLAVLSDPLARGAAIRHVAAELDLPATDLDRALGLRRPPRSFSARAPATDSSSSAAASDLASGTPLAPPAQVLAPAQVIAEEELLIALVRDPDLRPLAARLLPAERVADPVRAKLFKGLVAERSADVGVILDRFFGEKDAQQTLLDLVDRPIRAEPGKLFDGALRYFERKQKEKAGEEIRAGFRRRHDAGEAGASLEFLKSYDRHRRGGSGEDDETGSTEAPQVNG